MLDTRSAQARAQSGLRLHIARYAVTTAIIERAGGRCEADRCERAEARMFADHIHELRDGGPRFNLITGNAFAVPVIHSRQRANARAALLPLRLLRAHSGPLIGV